MKNVYSLNLIFLALLISCQKHSTYSSSLNSRQGGVVVEGGGGIPQFVNFYDVFSPVLKLDERHFEKTAESFFPTDYVKTRKEIERDFLRVGLEGVFRLGNYYFLKNLYSFRSNSKAFELSADEVKRIHFSWHEDLFDSNGERAWCLNDPATFEIKMNSLIWEKSLGLEQVEEACRRIFSDESDINLSDCERMLPHIVPVHELLSLKLQEATNNFVHSIRLIDLLL